MFYDLAVGAISASNGQLAQQIWQSHTLDGVEVATGGHSQRTRDESFATACGSENDDVVVVLFSMSFIIA